MELFFGGKNGEVCFRMMMIYGRVRVAGFGWRFDGGKLMESERNLMGFEVDKVLMGRWKIEAMNLEATSKFFD
jgi:hypothetical protein